MQIYSYTQKPDTTQMHTLRYMWGRERKEGEGEYLWKCFSYLQNLSAVAETKAVQNLCMYLDPHSLHVTNSTLHCPSPLMRSHPGASTTKNVHVCWCSHEYNDSCALPCKLFITKCSLKQIMVSDQYSQKCIHYNKAAPPSGVSGNLH